MSVKILHAADFHLDSPFAALNRDLSRRRRQESRDLLARLSDHVNREGVQLVLLAGDLFDGEITFRETLETLPEALGRMKARVFIAPGNHDPYGPRSPYAALAWPENVHVFKRQEVERVVLPELGCAVYGAAFTGPFRDTGALEGFRPREDPPIRLMVLHASLNDPASRYGPITREQIAASGLDYLALGHTHSFGGVQRAGATAYAYSGCPEGRGFDETGDKGVLEGFVSPGEADIRFVPFARRRYWSLTADVTGRRAEDAVRAVMPSTAAADVCRVTLRGETDERGIDISLLGERLAPLFYSLSLRDETHVGREIWTQAGEDSLRALFLRELRGRYDAAAEEERRRIELAARFGLAALDRRDL